MSIKNITDKILIDAKQKEAETLTKAREEADRIIDNKIKEASSLEENIIFKAKEEAVAKQNRIIQNAELKVRNNILEAKHQVIENAFSYALNTLENLSDNEYLSFLKAMIMKCHIKDSAVLTVNKKRYPLITSEVLQDISDAANVTLTLSQPVEFFKDGFIIEQNGIQINCIFEELVDSLKEELVFDITKILFE